MRPAPLLALALGAFALAALVFGADAGRVLAAVRTAGWGVLLVVTLHLPQTAASALGWAPLVTAADGGRAHPPLRRLFALRFVREAVNALLPVAQVGGDVVRARLLARSGVPAAPAAASCAGDLTVEVATQAAITALGALALACGPGMGAGGGRLAFALALAAAALALAMLVAQRAGVARRLGARLAAAGARRGWAGTQALPAFAQALRRLYADAPRLGASALAHLASWMLGVLETGAGLLVLGLHPGWREALVVESLGQAVRAVGFAIPGALGVQEGGYVLVCGLFGVPAASAIALSLLRRAREIALGAPGLILWQALEARSTPAAILAGEVP